MKKLKNAKLVPTRNWIVGVAVLVGMALVALVSTTASAAESTGSSSGACAAAMKQAASENKYLFAFFYEKDDDATRAARKSFDQALKKITPAPHGVAVDRTSAAEKETIAKFGVDRAPMPLVIAIAPNGAITGGIKTEDIKEEKLRDAVASAGLQQCLKGLQDRRLVMVCLQNGSTQGNEAAMKGVNDFKANSQFGSVTEIVKVDPSDPKELKLLSQLKADPQSKTATTAMLAPPGVLVTKVEGATSKDELAAALQKAMSSCAPGAGAGCCPAPAPKK